MRITYVARSFLDYRIPVLTELDKLCGNQLRFVSSIKWSPERALDRLRGVLGERATYLAGERSLGVDMPLESNTSFCIPYQPGLLRAIRQSRPEVLIGDGFFQWTFAALVHRILRGTPLVVCYERWSHTERRAQWYRKLYRWLALRFTAAICCNGSLSAEYTRTLGFPAQRITTGHMAADTETLAARVQRVEAAAVRAHRESLNCRGVVLLCVGRLIKIKGLNRLLDTWAAFEACHADQATLVIVGGGPEEQALRNQMEKLKLRQVRFVGTIDYNQLAPYYAMADSLIIPTLEDNWSLVVPEAMACGLPILCSRYNGCWPELVDPKRNGWVFDPLDPQSTVECLNDAVQHASDLPKMGLESRAMIAHHSPAHAAQAIFSACKMALEPKGRQLVSAPR